MYGSCAYVLIEPALATAYRYVAALLNTIVATVVFVICRDRQFHMAISLPSTAMLMLLLQATCSSLYFFIDPLSTKNILSPFASRFMIFLPDALLACAFLHSVFFFRSVTSATALRRYGTMLDMTTGYAPLTAAAINRRGSNTNSASSSITDNSHSCTTTIIATQRKVIYGPSQANIMGGMCYPITYHVHVII